MSKIELAKAYNAQEIEDGIYQKWEESGFFNPDNLKTKGEPFTISMPPANATGILHMGHALALATEDLMTRYARMKGERALWVPGTDHASIATQTKVEKIIAKEGLDRHQLGREKFLKRVEKYVEESRATIRKQIRKLGSSCDWSRESFTLDENLSRAVKEAFIRMHDDGLIYRGYRIVNWCPRCQSTLADDEVNYQTQKGKMYYFKYGPFEVATTRPETKIGDTALAVNPDDKRYQKYLGQTFDVDFGRVKVRVKVIGDKNVDPAFGTGVLGVTPAHSQIDYQMALANDLPVIQVIGPDGKMTPQAGPYEGMTILAAREAFLKDLKKKGLFIKEEDVENNLSVCYRCDTPVEPLMSDQWFVAVDKKFKLRDKKKLNWKKDEATLKELALHAVKSGLIKIVPERFEKTYFHWLENLRDWCVSRQIWYGHRIPVWYRDREIHVGAVAPKGDGWKQDEDTLDTWFSSALWTFSTLGWPENTKDLKTYHPTSVMETGYDIIFFWVARMIIMSAYCLNDIPFKTVYLHGMMRTEEGKKMSKSLGNAVDPLEMIGKYGTDALRLSLLIGIAPGNDVKIYEEKIAGFRNFANKLWNISRFILAGADEIEIIAHAPAAKTLADQWILARLNETILAVKNNLENFQFSGAGETMEQFIWNDFADWYLEIAKIEKDKNKILLFVLQNILKLLHPFCPFITEAVWQNFNGDKLLMVEKWPEAEKIKAQGDEFNLIKEIIASIRNLRAENKIEPAKSVNALIIAGKREKLISEQAAIIQKLARINELQIITKGVKPAKAVGAMAGGIEIYLDLAGSVDVKAEKARMEKEIAELKKYVASVEVKLANKEFIANAPKAIVEMEKEKLLTAKEKLVKLGEQLKSQ